MSTETREMLIEQFQELAKRIDLKAQEYDDVTVAAALVLRKLRAQVEADGLKWYGWAGEHLKMGKTKLRSLLRISEAEEPRAMIAHLRKQNAKHQRDFRARHKAPKILEAERRDLIRWVKTADLENVKQVLALVRQPRSRSVSSPDNDTAFQPSVH